MLRENIIRTFSYTLNITRLQATDVNVIIPAGTEAEIINAAGGVIQPLVCGEVVDGVYVNTYALTPGEEYDCIATKNRYFHTSARFTAAEGTDFTVSEPESTDKLTAVGAYTARNVGNANTRVYPLDRDFVSAEHEYMFTVSDANSSFFMKATCNDDAYEIHALYDKQTTIASTNGVPVDKLINSTVESAAGAVACGQFVASNCGYANTMILRLTKTVDSVEYYQEYTFVARRALSLGTLSAKTQANGIVNDIVLRDENGSIVKYDRDRVDYYATIALSIPEVIISASFKSTASETAPNKGGYYLLVNGERFDDPSNVYVSLDSALSSEDITVTICHEDDASVQSTYTLHLAKTAPTPVRFVTEPADAITFVISNSTSLSVPKNEDGTYSLIPGESYAYTVTKAGFAGIHESNYIPVQSDEVIEINAVLTAAEPNPNLDPNLDAQWPTFRANRFNNGVVDYPIPTIANDSVLYWATQFGSGYGSNACSCPIIVDDFLYVYAGTNIYKIDKTSGEALVTKSMAASSSFAINSPTYADGMIFVGLSNGRIQAFDAVTLDSLWLFTDSNGGQPNCPIVYHDGYIYTGFWKSETGDASFVCVSATDEDPDVGNETKYASWRYVSKGGFYWAGAYVCDEFVLIDTDDGESGYTDGHARIVSLNPTSGSVIGSITLPHPGDARSSVTFVPDDENGTSSAGTAYFTTKGGYFYAVHVEADGSFTEGSLSFVKLFNYADDTSNPAMSTCTPTVYNGRAYVGVSGTSQFGAYSGHNITVIDLESMSIAYTVRTKGYPQTSGVLTTAYAGDDDTVYVYFFDNFTPGMLRVIADRPGQTEPSAVVQEEYQGTTYDCAPVLFTPDGAQAQYAICSPIIDADGTIYFKNDSAYLMAVGSVVDRIEIAKLPDKTVYAIGETFDPTGMQVLAHYANGTVRDITAYIPVSPVNAPAELVDALSSWGITLEDRYSENELGEFDYCYASGWMYCLNNVFPNVGFSDSYLSDGDVVRVQFTVAYGSDIGGGYAMGGSDNTSFYLVANKDRLSTLIATLNEHGIEIPDSAMNAATAIYASQEDVNAAAAVLQQLEDEYQQNAPVRDVIAKISAIGEVSLESASAIAEARQAYDALTAEQQALVSNYDVLTAAEETLRTLIEELPVSASFSAPEITALSGQQVEIPVTVSGKFEAHTLEMHIGYDSTKLTVNEVVPGAILENTSMNVIDFTTTPGTIYVGALCADAPMTGNGIDENVLLTVKATVNPEFSGTTPVNVDVNRFVNLPVGGTVTDIEVHTTNGSVNASLPEYTLTYTVNGEFYAEQTYAVGAVITVPEYTVPEGYTFSGWVVPETMPAEDLTVDAVLSINVYTVTFVDRLDGSVIAEVSVEHGSNVTAPAAPAHDGYVFTGWNGSLVNVTENRTVTAEYSLLGDVDGDGVVTSADALTVLRMSLGIIATPVSGSLDFSICDIDGSGDITSVDALLIIRKAMQSA